MPNITSVTLTAGVPTAGTGTVGTLDNVTGTAGAPSVPVLTVQGVASGTAQPISAAALPLPTGAATSALQPTAAAQGSTTSGQTGSLVQGAVTTAAPTYTTAQTSPLSLDTTGALRVNVTAGGGTGGTSSSVGSAVPATATAIGFTDGTNMQLGVIKAASTAPVATDRAIVVALSPNTPGLVQTGTAGSPSAAVLSVQGVTSGSPVITANTPTPSTAAGLTSVSTIITTANGVLNVKASAGSIKKIEISNNDSVNYWFKLTNITTTPVAGTSAVARRLLVPAGSIVLISYEYGLDFSTGIGYFVTSGIADANTGAITASTVVVSIDYK